MEFGLECSSPFVPAHYQPACLLDLAVNRGVDSHRLLRGTGLFHDDILQGNRAISPAEFFQLIANLRQTLGTDDSSFLLGQHWLPGHFGPASHAIRHADNLHIALQRLEALSCVLSPLQKPRLRVDEHYAYVYWLDSYGSGGQRVFLLEALSAALTSMCRWLSGQRLPWQYQFRHAQPRYIEQYWVHLGEDVRFGCPLDQMRIPREYLSQPWSSASVTAGQVAEREAHAWLQQLPASAGFLDQLYDYLQENLRQPLGLERVAEVFQVSPATFKRKLHKHATGFQEQLDQARTSVAVYLYLSQGYSNDEVANYLHFNDSANFRRAFKRWTGMLPSELKTFLLL
ncbi:transcriptional regulator, AraC family [Halopseudomonas salegens]|uniref:Transcriptional regulator, AraC family n=2 Tax=Halopseudomonas salegens TaxID=1434072 RepID=A0A1H2HSU8_9GAMM|nr:transcriptional regulator, AraC family [Halopseudomonas salegens]